MRRRRRRRWCTRGTSAWRACSAALAAQVPVVRAPPMTEAEARARRRRRGSHSRRATPRRASSTSRPAAAAATPRSRASSRRCTATKYPQRLGVHDSAADAALVVARKLGPAWVEEQLAARERASEPEPEAMSEAEAHATAAAEGLTLLTANNESGYLHVYRLFKSAWFRVQTRAPSKGGPTWAGPAPRPAASRCGGGGAGVRALPRAGAHRGDARPASATAAAAAADDDGRGGARGGGSGGVELIRPATRPATAMCSPTVVATTGRACSRVSPRPSRSARRRTRTTACTRCPRRRRSWCAPTAARTWRSRSVRAEPSTARSRT